MTPASATVTPRPSLWRGPLLLLALCALLAVVAAGWHYVTADDVVLPVRPVAQLTPVPTTVATVPVGVEVLPVQANTYLVTQTYDVAGPFLRPEAAFALVGLLGVALAYFLATVSSFTRPAFVVGMALVIFLLMSLNADLLGVFDAEHQYFLVLSLAVLALPAYYFHAFRPDVRLELRLLLFAGLIVGLGTVLFTQSPAPAEVTALHLSGFFTVSGAVAFALLVVWVAFENVYGLLWLNTQAETPAGRFGLLPFLLASGLYLGTLLLYYWNNGEVEVLPGWHLDPLVLLLPAVLVGWLGLRRRAATYGTWIPYQPGMVHLYLILVLLGAAALGYALATANDPLLLAARDFTALALLCGGAAFLLYVLLNFAPLLRQKLPVHRVVYEPRRFPFYAMYGLGVGLLGLVLLRNQLIISEQVRAGYYNNLGDLARLQSELTPDDLSQALLAERYYAESDALDQHNHKASLGRAALYRFRLQRQNEINILRRALGRRPSEKISLRLAALYNEPRDFFDRLAVLRAALKAAPRSARLNGDLAQLYTRSALADSATYYQARAEAAAPDDAVLQANQLAYLIRQQQWAAATKLAQQATTASDDDALRSNALLLARFTGQSVSSATLPDTAAPLTAASFARLYHDGLNRAARHDTTLLPLLPYLANHPENGAYLDQLNFLRAFTLHYGGRPVAAQAAILPLATGSGAATAYYQQLQGLWLLDQHLAAPAASRLAEARQNGATSAALPAAYALALSNQLDSARRVARQAAIGTDLPSVQPARRLQAILEPDFQTNLPQAPDSLRVQYVVLRGDELPASRLLTVVEAITLPTLRTVALLAQLPRVIQAGQLEAARAALAQAPGVAAPTASAWNVQRGEVYARSQQWSELRQLVSHGRFEGFDQFYRLYFRAVLAEADQQPKQADQLYAQLVREAPFVENGLVAAARFYTNKRDFSAAYNTLLRGIEYNPESAPLLQAYALASIPVGLTEYAAAPLAHLGALLSPADYATFRREYEARRAANAPSAGPWN
ncbi:hypothetical protein K3G63_10150 [Hymenobacter sp. HSC-4F20]|uniref:tetratricopeptide repeat protein n=1 Tax=Hymenobacter sp. HSC-4F20 TaxID=2864135 RepID=UPI001C72F6D8|nr:hypothetical protein [Hymenobacter sp. HSC-4F20]MBX0290801.1 hypothetical protein [Hymenobacter sp. HSC-4F20]